MQRLWRGLQYSRGECAQKRITRSCWKSMTELIAMSVWTLVSCYQRGLFMVCIAQREQYASEGRGCREPLKSVKEQQPDGEQTSSEAVYSGQWQGLPVAAQHPAALVMSRWHLSTPKVNTPRSVKETCYIPWVFHWCPKRKHNFGGSEVDAMVCLSALPSAFPAHWKGYKTFNWTHAHTNSSFKNVGCKRAEKYFLVRFRHWEQWSLWGRFVLYSGKPFFSCLTHPDRSNSLVGIRDAKKMIEQRIARVLSHVGLENLPASGSPNLPPSTPENHNDAYIGADEATVADDTPFSLYNRRGKRRPRQSLGKSPDKPGTTQGSTARKVFQGQNEVQAEHSLHKPSEDIISQKPPMSYM